MTPMNACLVCHGSSKPVLLRYTSVWSWCCCSTQTRWHIFSPFDCFTSVLRLVSCQLIYNSYLINNLRLSNTFFNKDFLKIFKYNQVFQITAHNVRYIVLFKKRLSKSWLWLYIKNVRVLWLQISAKKTYHCQRGTCREQRCVFKTNK